MPVVDALNTFAKKVIKDSRSNLTRKDKKASSSLYKSLDYKVENNNGLYSVTFLMEDYGKFIDKGVKGVGGSKADGSKWKVKKVVNSPFKYTSKMPPAKAFSQWTVKRGIAPRNKKGQFQSRKGLQFAIAKSVYHTGIETTNFFTTPLERESLRLIDDLASEVLDSIEL